jgi:hypothetical protein
MPDAHRSHPSDPRLKVTSKYFLGGRLGAADAGAETLWAEGNREPALCALYGEDFVDGRVSTLDCETMRTRISPSA